nr:M23 family metallopeptidase [Saccharomonospora sp. CUA-673]
MLPAAPPWAAPARRRIVAAAVALALLGTLVTAHPAAPATTSEPGPVVEQEPVAGVESAIVLDWPLAPRPEVLRPFDPPPSPYGPGHRGVDLAAGPGQQVLAAADGEVVHAGDVAGRGVVSVQHAGGLRTTYEPVTPAAGIEPGAAVTRRQPIGTIAGRHAGCPAASCLHWGVRRGEDYLDPLEFVPPVGPLRLKPWPADEE